MSITLGEYSWTSKKTVGDITDPTYSEIDSAPPCVDTVNLTTLQPKWKKIHSYLLQETAIFNGTQYEISGINKGLPDDLFADGYDYRVTFDINYAGSGITVSKQHFSYTVGGNNWYQYITNSLVVIMNENNCGGSYANTARAVSLESSSLTAFSVTIIVNIEQLISATFRILQCTGDYVERKTELNIITESIEVLVEGEELTETVIQDIRDSNYNPNDIGFAELAKLPKNCTEYDVYYISEIFSNPMLSLSNPKTYWLDTGIYEVKINIPITPPQILDFNFYDGLATIFSEPSDSSGLIDWMAFSVIMPNSYVELQIFNGGVQQSTSGEQYVYFKYDLNTYDCPCECDPLCDGEIDITFNLSCDRTETIRVRASIQEGRYSLLGESYNDIKPVVRTGATYELVISDYTDEVFLILMDLFADCYSFDIYDNIIPNTPTNYTLDADELTPQWNFNSQIGVIKLPIKRTDTVKTRRKGCCN